MNTGLASILANYPELAALSGAQGPVAAQAQSPYSGRRSRGEPLRPPPIPQPGNLSSIYAQAGPYMQQALGLAGQAQPQAQAEPMHVAPPQPGQFAISPIQLMQMTQWLSALNGRM